MSHLDVIEECQRRSIRLGLKDGKLVLRDPNGNLTPGLRENLRQFKSQLVVWLTSGPTDSAVIAPYPTGLAQIPLSFAQQRLWLVDALSSDGAQYNVPVAMKVDGPLQRAVLQSVLDRLVEHHAILRTTYDARGGEPYQVIGAPMSVPIKYLDLSSVAQSERDAAVRDRVRAEFRQTFDLRRDLMLRCIVIRVAPDSHVLVLVMHHIACDGWSMPIVTREFAHLYEALAAGRECSSSPPSVQYADFAYWQRKVLPPDTFDTGLQYWRTQLTDAPRLHSLPLDGVRPAAPRYVGEVVEQKFSSAFAEQLNRLARKHNASLFMVLYSAYAMVLARWADVDDLLIGVPSTGRQNSPQLESVVGFFVNTLVFRTRLQPNMSFGQLIEQSRQVAFDAYAHDAVPFDLLVEELAPERSAQYAPLCQVTFTMQTRAGQKSAQMSSLELTRFDADNDIIKFDLELSATEHEGGIQVLWRFASDLFERSSISRMSDALLRVLQEAVQDPLRPLQAFEWVDQKQRALVLALSCGPIAPAAVSTLPQRILAQGQRTPTAVALCDAEHSLDYTALISRSGRLAACLTELGVQPGDLVAVVCERSCALMIGLLGVLRCGAAYVPIDINTPVQRVAAILADAGIETVVTMSQLSATLPVAGIDLVYLDGASIDGGWLEEYEEDGAQTCLAQLDDTAYVIYTSGSTGLPKGVRISHRSLAEYCKFAVGYYYDVNMSGSLVVTSHAFDITVPALFLPLLSGHAAVMLTPDDTIGDLVRQLRTRSGERPLVRLTPTHVLAMLAVLREQVLSVSAVFVIGGEVLSGDVAAHLQRCFPNGDLFNHYGPTEATVGCAVYRYQDERTGVAVVPIGRPMGNTQLYVMDSHDRLCPIGVPGQLHIGGSGLSQGYVGQPALTAEKFIHDRFAGQGELYRSGDIVRWLDDGNLQFIGRADAQIKLRGYRVEPGEIEYALRRQREVVDAAVMLGAQSEVLTAYVALDSALAGAASRMARALRHGLVAEEQVFELPNGMEVCGLNRAETDYLYDELLVKQSYLRHGISVGEGDCVLDVGANIGLFSVALLAGLKSVRVVAFEPFPEIFAALETNFDIYGADRATACCVGLSDAPGSATYAYFPHASVFSGVAADAKTNLAKVRQFLDDGELSALDPVLLEEMLEDRLASTDTQVSLRTLSQEIERLDIAQVDLLKIDVERNELRVLHGIDDAHWLRIRQIVLEAENDAAHVGEISRLLKSRGYRVRVEQSEVLAGTGLVNVFATQGQWAESASPLSIDSAGHWRGRGAI